MGCVLVPNKLTKKYEGGEERRREKDSDRQERDEESKGGVYVKERGGRFMRKTDGIREESRQGGGIKYGMK
jgi:hypothetical protein